MVPLITPATDDTLECVGDTSCNNDSVDACEFYEEPVPIESMVERSEPMLQYGVRSRGENICTTQDSNHDSQVTVEFQHHIGTQTRDYSHTESLFVPITVNHAHMNPPRSVVTTNSSLSRAIKEYSASGEWSAVNVPFKDPVTNKKMQPSVRATDAIVAAVGGKCIAPVFPSFCDAGQKICARNRNTAPAELWALVGACFVIGKPASHQAQAVLVEIIKSIKHDNWEEHAIYEECFDVRLPKKFRDQFAIRSQSVSGGQYTDSFSTTEAIEARNRHKKMWEYGRNTPENTGVYSSPPSPLSTGKIENTAGYYARPMDNIQNRKEHDRQWIKTRMAALYNMDGTRRRDGNTRIDDFLEKTYPIFSVPSTQVARPLQPNAVLSSGQHKTATRNLVEAPWTHKKRRSPDTESPQESCRFSALITPSLAKRRCMLPRPPIPLSKSSLLPRATTVVNPIAVSPRLEGYCFTDELLQSGVVVPVSSSRETPRLQLSLVQVLTTIIIHHYH